MLLEGVEREAVNQTSPFVRFQLRPVHRSNRLVTGREPAPSTAASRTSPASS